MVDVTILNTTSYTRAGFVTLGIPFPSGQLFSGEYLVADGATSQRENVQWYPQGARWGDNSVKYARATLPVSIGASTEKFATVIKSSSADGATSTFNVPIQASINDTRFRLSIPRKDFYIPTRRILSWSIESRSDIARIGNTGVTISVTRIVYEGTPIVGPDSDFFLPRALMKRREKDVGWDDDFYITGNSGAYNLASVPGFKVLLNFSQPGPYYDYATGVGEGLGPFTFKAVKGPVVNGNPSIYLVGVADSRFVFSATANNTITIGLWQPTYAPEAYIDLDLRDATLIEGNSSSASHYRRYKLFKRGDDSPTGLPKPLWAEIVFNVYKNSDTIEYWFSWGQCYVGNTDDSAVLNNTGGPYPEYSYYYHNRIELRVTRLVGTSTLVPRVSMMDSEYQLVSGPTLVNGTTTCVLLDSNFKPVFDVTTGDDQGTYKRVGTDNLPHGYTKAYKGFVVYNNTPSQSNLANLQGTSGPRGYTTGREILAMANWNGRMPPFRVTHAYPSYIAGRSDSITRNKRFIDQTETSTQVLNEPNLLDDTFLGGVNHSGTGSHGLLFNSLQGYWMILSSDPYSLRLLKLVTRQEFLKPIRRRNNSGNLMRYLDYVHPTNRFKWYFTVDGINKDNSDMFAGLGLNRFNTGVAPAPNFQGIYNNNGPKTRDSVYSVGKTTTNSQGWFEEQVNVTTGWKTSHIDCSYSILTAFITMDYHAINQCEANQLACWSDAWSQTRASNSGVDPGGIRKRVPRTVSRPLYTMAKLLEILGPGRVTAEATDGEWLDEIKRRLNRIEYGYTNEYLGPSSTNFLVRQLYGAELYETKVYPFSIENPFNGGQEQEYCTAGWQDLMGCTHYWGLRKVLLEHPNTTGQTEIAKKLVKDMSAYVMRYVRSADEEGMISFDKITQSSNPDDFLPMTTLLIGDIVEVANNPNVYATVTRIGTNDTRSDGINSITVDISYKNRVGLFSTGNQLRVRRTGALFRSRNGTHTYVVNYNPGSDYGTAYYASVAIRPEDYSLGILCSGGRAPDYYGYMPSGVIYQAAMDYVYDETTYVPYRRGTQFRPYTSGLSRYGYISYSTNTWGYGTIPIAINLALAGEYGSASTDILNRAQAWYNYNITRMEYAGGQTNTFETDVGINMFTEPISTDPGTRHVGWYPDTITLTSAIFQPSGRFNVNYSGTSPVTGRISLRQPTIRPGTGVRYSGITESVYVGVRQPIVEARSQGPVHVNHNAGTYGLSTTLFQPSGIITEYDVNWQWYRSNDGGFTRTTDPYILSASCLEPASVTTSTVRNASYSGSNPIELTVVLDDDIHASSYNVLYGVVKWSRNIKARLGEDAAESDFTGLRGTYGDPSNNGTDTGFGTEGSWRTFVGEYISAEMITGTGFLGYPDLSIMSPGHKVVPAEKLSYTDYLLYQSVYWPTETVPTE